jgi:hypothetical protein
MVLKSSVPVRACMPVPACACLCLLACCRVFDARHNFIEKDLAGF